MLKNSKSFSKKSLSNILDLTVENLSVDDSFTSQEITDINTNLSSLNTRLTSAENNITTLETDLNNIEDDVDNNETAITLNTNDITVLENLTQDLSRNTDTLILSSKIFTIYNGKIDTGINNTIRFYFIAIRSKIGITILTFVSTMLTAWN